MIRLTQVRERRCVPVSFFYGNKKIILGGVAAFAPPSRDLLAVLIIAIRLSLEYIKLCLSYYENSIYIYQAKPYIPPVPPHKQRKVHDQATVHVFSNWPGWDCAQGVGTGGGCHVFFVVILFSPRFLWKRMGDSPACRFFWCNLFFLEAETGTYISIYLILSSWVHILSFGGLMFPAGGVETSISSL